MNILFVTRKYPPSVGGMQKHSSDLYHYLSKTSKVRLISWGRSQKFLFIFVLFALIKSIYIIIRYKVEIVHLGDSALLPLGAILKVIFKKPIVSTAYGLDIIYPLGIYQFILSRFIRLVDGFICVSHATEELLLNKNISEEKLFIVPIGIRKEEIIDREDKGKARDSLGKLWRMRLENKRILLTVGRLVSRKGVSYFLEKIFPELNKRIQDLLYIVVGDGKDRETIEKQIRENNFTSKVLMTGKLMMGSDILNKIYSCADVFVMPNIHIQGDFEGLGIVALEASMRQLPVVAFGVDGVPDAVQDGQNGILVDENDVQSYIDATIKLLEDEEYRKRLGVGAKEYISKYFDWDIIIERYIDAYRKILNKH